MSFIWHFCSIGPFSLLCEEQMRLVLFRDVASVGPDGDSHYDDYHVEVGMLVQREEDPKEYKDRLVPAMLSCAILTIENLN